MLTDRLISSLGGIKGIDGYEVNVTDSPRANEIMFCLAMTKGPRIDNRMGGLEPKDILG